MTGQSPRQRLLDAVIAHVAEHGISDLSLRELAAAIGTSHRMLIHHFGGKDGLRVAVVHEVEARQRAAALAIDPSLPLDEAMRAFWQHISGPEGLELIAVGGPKPGDGDGVLSDSPWPDAGES